MTAQRPRTRLAPFRTLTAWVTGGDMNNHTRHRNVQGGASRAAVLGAGDGLITNMSLILGVAGATYRRPRAVRLAGVAGLLAGAFSMAAGELVSVRAQDELVQRELQVERQELTEHPNAERRELAGHVPGPRRLARGRRNRGRHSFQLRAGGIRHPRPARARSGSRGRRLRSTGQRRVVPLLCHRGLLATDSLAILRGTQSGHHFDLHRRSGCRGCSAQRSGHSPVVGCSELRSDSSLPRSWRPVSPSVSGAYWE